MLRENIVGCDQFDCVTTAGCLEGVCQDVASFRQGVKRLRNLLKDEGYIIAFIFLGDEHYNVGEKMFGALSLSAADVEGAFKDAGFKDIVTRANVYDEHAKYGDEDVHEGFITVFARK